MKISEVGLVCSTALLTTILLSSCGNTRQLTYMQGKFDTTKLSQLPEIDPVIMKGDLISIVVYSDNPSATAIFNQSLITVPSGQSSTQSGGSNGAGQGGLSGGGTGALTGLSNGAPAQSPGYLVDENGNITFQGLGLLHIEGLTKAQLKDTLDQRLKDQLKHPYYTIRFMNYRFTMLGEIARPGVYSMPGESVSLLEALGMAGDMTFFGRRDNVLVIRSKSGKREFARLDLTKPDAMTSPYFYLQTNDLIYIEANKKKVAANDQVTARNVAIAASIVSTLAIVYSIFR